MPGLQGARSGGMTHHIQGPHLIPNVGREAMLAAEVVRRKPKSKAKAEKPDPKPVSKSKVAKKEKKRKEAQENLSRSFSRQFQVAFPDQKSLSKGCGSFSCILFRES
mmetsp:Transcript_81595/g.166232  ORF Transcript_81595/g.166232 Transcript_81595/m.166232 type:complete len:107 (-) Transcript_81595:473-793(-)